jgi:hypothetical protein
MVGNPLENILEDQEDWRIILKRQDVGLGGV